ncbi:hypothetical protein B0H16DRAFT_1460419 [Mycena metata]|uniref:Uncharacterized protein n=1 Tax=Mycena metata TaxID=1033252 RepID=A0AAD7IV36_9AGAR|nr:hypothetical protein B0H16DRAFT_1460419 [Mycena metata]
MGWRLSPKIRTRVRFEDTDRTAVEEDQSMMKGVEGKPPGNSTDPYARVYRGCATGNYRSRWRWPVHIIRDPILTKFIYEGGLERQKGLEKAAQEEGIGQRNPSRNA